MKHWETKRGYKIYLAQKFRANSYLINTDKGNILIDTGMAPEYRKLIKNINKLNLKPEGIQFLFLTHTHFDHSKNSADIKQKYNCKIITSAKEAGFVEEGYTKIPKGAVLWGKMLSSVATPLGKSLFGYKPFTADYKITEDSPFPEIDSNIKIILTPGHTEGSISLIVDDEIAIVGDALFGAFSNSAFPPFANDIPEAIRTWEKLLATNCNIFLSGHGKEIKKELLVKEYEKYSKKYLLN